MHVLPHLHVDDAGLSQVRSRKEAVEGPPPDPYLLYSGAMPLSGEYSFPRCEHEREKSGCLCEIHGICRRDGYRTVPVPVRIRFVWMRRMRIWRAGCGICGLSGKNSPGVWDYHSSGDITQGIYSYRDCKRISPV